MKWWEGYSGINCTFAIDFNSVVTDDKVFFSNDSSKFLSFLNGQSKAKNASTKGFELENFTFKNVDINQYKSLNISDTDLAFSEPQPIENEFTLILKCRVNQSTVFLCNTTSDYGPTFGVGLHNNTVSTGSDDWVWSCSGFLPPDKSPNKSVFDIKTLVIKGNMSSKEVYFYTEYGTIQVPKNSTAFTTGFLIPRTYSTVGYKIPDGRWRVNSDIIAYGIFDGILSDSQVENLKNSIDSEFKLNIIKTKVLEEDFYSQPIMLRDKFKTRIENLKTLEERFQATKSVRTFIKETVLDAEKGQMYSYNILYKNTKSITDIVLEEGVPVVTKLYLYERHTGQLIKVTSSNSLGVFSFLDLEVDLEYIVRASDSKYQFHSIIKDYN